MTKLGWHWKEVITADFAIHLRAPLYRNGYALLLSGLASSGLGMIYWLLAARSYPAATVGLNSALISAMMLLSGLAQFSLNSALVRFTPRAGRQTGALIGYAYLVSALIGGVICALLPLGLERWVPSARFLTGNLPLYWGFVLSILAWSVFSLQDSALAGLRQAMWVPLENMLVAVVKIGLVLLLAHYDLAYGIFVAWMIPVLASLLPINMLIFRRLLPAHVVATAGHAVPLVTGQIGRYVLGNYLGSLFFMASTTLLPILVTQQLGAQANAYFHMPWMIATALQLIALNLTTSLTVEATRDETKLALLCYDVLRQSMRLLAPLVMIIAMAAPFILQLFGPAYAAEGVTTLRLLALAAIPNGIVMLYVTLKRVHNHIAGIVAVQGTISALVLGLSYTLVGRLGIAGVGVAWLTSQTLVAAVLLSRQLGPLLLNGRAASRLR